MIQKEGLLNMPVPRVNMPKYKKTERSKMMDIVVQLYRMGYNVDNARDAIQIIEVFKLDKSQFNFPYGSFEEAKKHVLFVIMLKNKQKC